MNEKLKPCPFCGSTDIELRKGVIFNGAAHCMDCTADVVFEAFYLVTEGGDWREAVRARWNRRAGEVVNDCHDLVKDLVKEGGR